MENEPEYTMRGKYLGWLVWLLAMAFCIPADAVVWAWMLGYLRVPRIFEFNPALLGVLHLACLALTCAAFLLVLDKHRRNFWFVTLIVVVTTMPAVGILLCCIAFVFGRPPKETTFEDDFKSMERPMRTIIHPVAHRFDTGNEQDFPNHEEYLDMMRLKWLDVQPIHDIMSGTDPIRKRNAIHKIADRPNPESVGLLRQCLEDDDREIRFAAGSALGRIEKNCTDTLTFLKGKSAGKDPIEFAKDWEHLAAHYLFMADLDIGTREMRDFYRASALKIIEDLPSDNRSMHLHVIALAGLKRHAEVLALLGPLEDLDDGLAAFKCDAMLKQADFRGLAYYLTDIRERAGRETPLGETLSWWTQAEVSNG